MSFSENDFINPNGTIRSDINTNWSTEIYDEETETWEKVDGYGGVYVVDDTYQKEWENAVSQIKEFSGNHELFDEDVANNAIEHHTIDILCRQKVFEFMES